MKLSTNAAPLLFAVTLLAAGGLALTQANAAEVRLSDVGYINAARCAGLAHGVGIDAVAFDRIVERQAAGREPIATVLAESAGESAAHEARLSGYWRARAAAEISRRCQAATSNSEALAHARLADGHAGR